MCLLLNFHHVVNMKCDMMHDNVCEKEEVFKIFFIDLLIDSLPRISLASSVLMEC